MVVVRLNSAVLLNPYGVRGERHPNLPEYWSVKWDGGGGGYYPARAFRVIGTAFD